MSELRLKLRRTAGKEKRTIHAEHLQPNIVLFDDINDPLSDTKASIIDNDANSRPDIY
jgi:hypothetical protein